MAELDADIAAYEKMRLDLEADHLRKWVLIYREKRVGIFETFNEAANEAVKKFGRGPYLIRQIGISKITLPASVMFRPART